MYKQNNVMIVLIKSICRWLTPPIITAVYRYLRFHTLRSSAVTEVICLKGDYPSWRDAMADSTGYDAEIILDKTRAAMRKIRDGESVYERDSVLFDHVQYAWPLLAGLMWASARAGGQLNVLDFGGALGSSYYQNRAFLAGIKDVKWNVVEQPMHVQVGKEEFETEELRFFNSISECIRDNDPDVIVLSGVLQSLENPFVVLNELFKVYDAVFIIDRMPFWDGSLDKLCVQHTPSSIYPASYPSWVFSKSKFRRILDNEFDVVAEFDALDSLKNEIGAYWRGMILTRNKKV